MSAPPPLDREEWIEQVYFFRMFRERLAENLSAQEILARAHEEILTTTRLPLAIQFVATELRHSGQLHSGFAKLPHYFTPFQTFTIQQAEDESRRFTMPVALLLLEREAHYKSGTPSQSGLFAFQFECICRNRLGYDAGVMAMANDPIYSQEWRDYLLTIRKQVGVLDFADMVYLRSEEFVREQRRIAPEYQPKFTPILGEKEGKIAKASRKRDPLYFFAALQRQLNYPEVPRNQPRDDSATRFDMMATKIREMEARMRLIESEMRGNVDLSQYGPDSLPPVKDDWDD